MNKIIFNPIGIVHSPFKKMEGTPIQSFVAKNTKGRVEIYPEFTDGLKDLEGFSHIQLLFHFHLSKKFNLRVKPYMDDEFHGVFATRAPSRPNGIGLSVVKLIKIENNILHIENLDIIDGTPLLDIKPYVMKFDKVDDYKIGWLKKRVHRVEKTIDDGRFNK